MSDNRTAVDILWKNYLKVEPAFRDENFSGLLVDGSIEGKMVLANITAMEEYASQQTASLREELELKKERIDREVAYSEKLQGEIDQLRNELIREQNKSCDHCGC